MQSGTPNLQRSGIIAHHDFVVTLSVHYNPPASLVSHFPGFALFLTGISCQSCSCPRTQRAGPHSTSFPCLFKLLAPFLKEADLQFAVRDLYRGTLCLLLVLLYDFFEFLSEYCFSLCDIIPPRCIRLRNTIISAFALSVVLPDPHLRNIKFDSIPEMGPIPPILSDFASGVKSADLRNGLDQYLLNRGATTFLPSLKDRLKLSVVSEGTTEAYSLSLINSLVMYVGVSSVARAKARSGSSVFVPSDPDVVALQYLATNLDVEGAGSFVCLSITYLCITPGLHHLLSSMVLHL